MPARRGTRAAAPVEPEVEELEELDDVEELELDDEPEELEPEPAPKRGTRKTTKAAAPAKATKKAAPAKATTRKADEDEDADTANPYDSGWLADYVNETLDTDYDSRAIRMVLRKLARDEVIEREIGTDRSRYTFTGPGDPRVKAVLKACRSGSVEEEKGKGVAAAKATRATKAAAAPAKATKAPAKTTRRRTRAAAAEEDDE